MIIKIVLLTMLLIKQQNMQQKMLGIVQQIIQLKTQELIQPIIQHNVELIILLKILV